MADYLINDSGIQAMLDLAADIDKARKSLPQDHAAVASLTKAGDQLYKLANEMKKGPVTTR